MNKHYVCVIASNDKSIHVDVIHESSEIKIKLNPYEGECHDKLVFYEEYKDKLSADERKHEIDSWMKLRIKKVVDIYNPQWEDWSNRISLNHSTM
jgi:hypothetical protein